MRTRPHHCSRRRVAQSKAKPGQCERVRGMRKASDVNYFCSISCTTNRTTSASSVSTTAIRRMCATNWTQRHPAASEPVGDVVCRTAARFTARASSKNAVLNQTRTPDSFNTKHHNYPLPTNNTLNKPGTGAVATSGKKTRVTNKVQFVPTQDLTVLACVSVKYARITNTRLTTRTSLTSLPHSTTQHIFTSQHGHT